MKKGFLILVILAGILSPVFAKHITGGEMIYDYLGPGASVGTKRYNITLRLFRDDNCISCAGMPANVSIAIFDNNTSANISGYINVGLSFTEILPINALPPCITNPPLLEYTVGYYTFEIELVDNNDGYTAAYQTCCRIDGIQNIPDQVGATYITTIPGKNVLGILLNDNSPRFSKGISVVCYNKPFTLDFSATDPDGDLLIYKLCDAFNGGGARNAGYTTPAGPPYYSVSYTNSYSGLSPLGPLASINSSTGIISGIAPNAGNYVVSVCVESYKGGKYIATHRKDFIITVAACDLPGAKLVTPYYINCDSYLVNFTNLVESPLNLTFDWDFGDPASGANNFSTAGSPAHNFSDTGVFLIKLIVNKGSSCADSATAPVRIFPGYFPAFKQNSPACKNVPVQFNDLTTASFGAPTMWQWDFGVPGSSTDISTLKNPTFTYTTAGTYIATLKVSTNKGCTSTLTQDVVIVDKPAFSVTNDTLICTIDTLQLRATPGVAGGAVTWSPNYNINDINSFTPLVSPDVTTVYYARFDDKSGCTARDSVKINVVSQVSLQLANDSTICRTDSILLKINSDALYYNWTPVGTLNNAAVKNPVARPIAPSTTYKVTASISSKCFKSGNIIIKTVPYPLADAGQDTSVCFGNSAMLLATGGSIYSWAPTIFLNNSFISNPVSLNPTVSIKYIVTVRDTLGCPKPVLDTVLVTVVKINADAGPRDTSVILGQPLQLLATGSVNFLWTPARWLSNPGIFKPIALPQDNIEYTVRVSDAQGCFALDSINVKVYKVEPGLYVPTAFSPGGDGINDIFRPIALGIKSLENFRVYNRWGQLVYATTRIGQGWDGKFGGIGQQSGTFVWFANATDYLGRKITRKGTVILIR